MSGPAEPWVTSTVGRVLPMVSILLALLAVAFLSAAVLYVQFWNINRVISECVEHLETLIQALNNSRLPQSLIVLLNQKCPAADNNAIETLSSNDMKSSDDQHITNNLPTELQQIIIGPPPPRQKTPAQKGRQTPRFDQTDDRLAVKQSPRAPRPSPKANHKRPTEVLARQSPITQWQPAEHFAGRRRLRDHRFLNTQRDTQVKFADPKNPLYQTLDHMNSTEIFQDSLHDHY